MNGLAQSNIVGISKTRFGSPPESSNTAVTRLSQWVVALPVTLVLVGPASAESCTISREYILDGVAGDLIKSAKTYDDLFKTCVEVLSLTNVRDAYILKDGGIAIVPVRDTVIATAQTLAQFCERFPRGTARFLTPHERSKTQTVGSVVSISSEDATSCPKIRGTM